MYAPTQSCPRRFTQGYEKKSKLNNHYGNSLVLHCAPSTAHKIPTSKMAAVLPTSTKRTNKGRFCRAKAFIRNNNAADRLTASWFAIEKQENERNVRDPEVCSGFSLRGRRVVELLKCPG